jgi:broad specificity phosphatase PhoE
VTRLLIARHARAALPEDLRLPGPDLPLLPEGEAQARALAFRLRPVNPSAVYASDARRARHTGEFIATICDVELHLLPALREIDFGAWGGQAFAEVAENDPLAGRWFTDPTIAPPPDGEQVADAAGRVIRVFDRFSGDETEPVVIVGHSGSLRLALAQALGMPLPAYWRFRLDCAGLSIVDWTPEGPIVNGLNDVLHLDDDPRPPAEKSRS